MAVKKENKRIQITFTKENADFIAEIDKLTKGSYNATRLVNMAVQTFREALAVAHSKHIKDA